MRHGIIQDMKQVFLGRDYARHSTHSEQTLQDIDAEVKRIVMEQFERARHILESNRPRVETLTEALLDRESIDADEFSLIMNGEALPEPEIEIDHSTGEEDEPGPEPASETPRDDG